jgi:hypothetical protein
MSHRSKRKACSGGAIPLAHRLAVVGSRVRLEAAATRAGGGGGWGSSGGVRRSSGVRLPPLVSRTQSSLSICRPAGEEGVGSS